MGKMMPVTHICAYVVVPLEEGKPKSLIFAQTAWDGCARQRQIETLDKISETLDQFSLSVPPKYPKEEDEELWKLSEHVFDILYGSEEFDEMAQISVVEMFEKLKKVWSKIYGSILKEHHTTAGQD